MSVQRIFQWPPRKEDPTPREPNERATCEANSNEALKSWIPSSSTELRPGQFRVRLGANSWHHGAPTSRALPHLTRSSQASTIVIIRHRLPKGLDPNNSQKGSTRIMYNVQQCTTLYNHRSFFGKHIPGIRTTDLCNSRAAGLVRLDMAEHVSGCSEELGSLWPQILVEYW